MTCTLCLNDTCLLPARIEEALKLLPLDLTKETSGRRRTVMAPWWGVHQTLRTAVDLCRNGEYDKGHVRFHKVLNGIKKSNYKFDMPLDFCNALFDINAELLKQK